MTRIDTPDFDEALAGDRSGSFHHAVQLHLESSLGDVRCTLARGVTPLEFEQASKIEAALVRATDVLRLSAHLSRTR